MRWAGFACLSCLVSACGTADGLQERLLSLEVESREATARTNALLADFPVDDEAEPEFRSNEAMRLAWDKLDLVEPEARATFVAHGWLLSARDEDLPSKAWLAEHQPDSASVLPVIKTVRRSIQFLTGNHAPPSEWRSLSRVVVRYATRATVGVPSLITAVSCIQLLAMLGHPSFELDGDAVREIELAQDSAAMALSGAVQNSRWDEGRKSSRPIDPVSNIRAAASLQDDIRRLLSLL